MKGDFMQNTCKQLSFVDINHNLNSFFEDPDAEIISKFNDHFNISKFVPLSFYSSYNSRYGRKRTYDLSSYLYCFIFKSLLSISSMKLFIRILYLSKELREFCGFDSSIPDEAQFSRFKINFHSQINLVFHNLVEYTEILSDELNPFLASILISDTTGIEAYVAENNPKFYESELRKAKTFAKQCDDDFDYHKFAQSKMPKLASSNNEIKLTYLNGHFGYYLKTFVSTNGLGLIRDINFYNVDNSLSLDRTPKEVKDIYDSKSLIPSLETYFQLHPNFHYKYFLGDSGFDGDENYAYLYEEKNIIPIINLNPRNKSSLPKTDFNEDGVPLCPKDGSLPMIYDGITREKGRADRIKYLCPKVKKTIINGKTSYILNCEHPCTSSKCGRIKQITIHHNYRFNTAMPRDSLKWKKLYKLRTICERANHQFKSLMQLNSSKIRNTTSLKSDVLFAGIAQLASFIVIFNSNTDASPISTKSLFAS